MTTLREQIKIKLRGLARRHQEEMELMKELLEIRARVGWETQKNFPFPIWFHLKIVEKDSYIQENLHDEFKIRQREKYLYKKFEGLTLTEENPFPFISLNGGE